MKKQAARHEEYMGKQVAVFDLRCLMCNQTFDSYTRTEPTCNDACWQKFLKAWRKGEAIPGLGSRKRGES